MTTGTRVGAQQHSLGESDVVALEKTFDRNVLELDETLFAFEIGEQAVIDDLRRHAEIGGDILKDGSPVEGSVAETGRGGGAKDGGPQFLGRMAGHRLELAAILEQLGKPLMHELARIVAERLALIVVEFAACATVLAAEHLQQPLGDLAPGRVFGVEIMRHDAIPGEADTDLFAGEHRILIWLRVRGKIAWKSIALAKGVEVRVLLNVGNVLIAHRDGLPSRTTRPAR